MSGLSRRQVCPASARDLEGSPHGSALSRWGYWVRSMEQAVGGICTPHTCKCWERFTGRSQRMGPGGPAARPRCQSLRGPSSALDVACPASKDRAAARWAVPVGKLGTGRALPPPSVSLLQSEGAINPGRFSVLHRRVKNSSRQLQRPAQPPNLETCGVLG